MNIEIPYGKKYLKENISDNYRIDIFNICSNNVVSNPEEKILISLNNPIESEKLENIIKENEKICIIVDDITRPTPTKILIKPIIKLIESLNVKKDNVTIIFANGGHRPQTKEEMINILGRYIVDNYKIVNHDAKDRETLKYLGLTKRGTPVFINKIVIESDLRILIGMVKPHNQAGYSGGGKSLIPGVAGLETILGNHSFKYVNDVNSRIGVIEKNPIREDIEEVRNLIGKCYIVNAILNPDKTINDIVSGDVIAAHRKGVEILNSFSRISIKKQYDIVIAGCGYPVGINFYQTLNAITAPIRLKTPIIKKNGTIIVSSECPEGIGHKEFFKIASTIKGKPEIFLKNLSESKEFKEEQYAAQIWAEVLSKVRVIVITEGISKEELSEIGAVGAKSINEAMNMIKNEYPVNSDILILPNAPYAICEIKI